MRRRLVLGALGAALLAGRSGAAPADAGAAEPMPEVRAAAAAALAPQRFEFCHKPDYPLTPAEKRWCDLGAGANAAACPTLRQACQREAMARQHDLDRPWTFRLPNLGLPWRVLLWAMLGLGLGLLLYALARHFLERDKQEVVTTAAPAPPAEAAAALRAREVETDVQRLLERARTEAAAGDFRAAIGSAYAALLRRLEGAGLLRVEPDRTNGDYVGMVRKERPAIVLRVTEVVDSVERAQFGEKAATRDQFDGVWSRVTGLLAERVGVLLIGVGLLCATACGAPRADWEHSPSGRAGVIAFLGKRGFAVHERFRSIAKLSKRKTGEPRGEADDPVGSRATQLVLLPGAQTGEAEWRAIEEWVDKGGRTLVIAGGSRELPAWIGARVTEVRAEASETITPDGENTGHWGSLRVRVPDANRVETELPGSPLLRRGPSVYATERWLEELVEPEDDGEAPSRVVVLADDHLFRNASLLVADNAAALDALLRDGGKTVELLGDLTGLVSANPVESVRRGRLGPALLQLLVFFLLLFACKGARFGRPLPERRSERREFAEHVAALGLLYARARAERVALGALGTYAVERLRERFGQRADRSLSGLAEAVAARSGRPVGEVMRLFLEARDAGKGVPADKDARDLETAWQLGKLLAETGGTGGHKRIQDNV
ncbi:MAG: DUF4129 domain-containing protein [Deltaproteobacteria bacterium]|nr:DUF4129 domain-containing protein [Deltaproteobacteria bacterium]